MDQDNSSSTTTPGGGDVPSSPPSSPQVTVQLDPNVTSPIPTLTAQTKPGVERSVEVNSAVYIATEDAGSKYVEMLMRHLPDGSLLHKIVDATSKELWDGPLPVLFGTKIAAQVSPELFCRTCKVHLGMWDAFHGSVIETGGKPPVRVCSNNCLMQMLDHPPIVQPPTTMTSASMPSAFMDDYEFYEEQKTDGHDTDDGSAYDGTEFNMD